MMRRWLHEHGFAWVLDAPCCGAILGFGVRDEHATYDAESCGKKACAVHGIGRLERDAEVEGACCMCDSFLSTRSSIAPAMNLHEDNFHCIQKYQELKKGDLEKPHDVVFASLANKHAHVCTHTCTHDQTL